MTQISTVTGPIAPEAMGITMAHIHLLFELTAAEQRQLQPDMTASERALQDKPITMDILGLLRRNAFAVKDNMIMGDVEEAIAELMLYKRMGGMCVAEASCIGLRRDPKGLRQISGATGVHIMCSTGWYISASHPPFVLESSLEELSESMVKELTEGIGNSGIRAGFIKAAMSARTPDVPFTGEEEKVLRAGARAQSLTGAALTMHPAHHAGLAKHGHTYLDIILQEGGDLQKCILNHTDFWYSDLEYQTSLLDRGVTLAYDQFGSEDYYSPGRCKPSDQARVQGVVSLLKAGYAGQLVLSNEAARKTHLKKYGGYGYAHVLENIVPDLRYFGVEEKHIHAMLVENPRRLFSF
jgi:phosphotriesterase-related protein